MPRHIIIKLMKTKDIEKILEVVKKNSTLPIREKLFEWQWISHQKLWRTKEVAE